MWKFQKRSTGTSLLDDKTLQVLIKASAEQRKQRPSSNPTKQKANKSKLRRSNIVTLDDYKATKTKVTNATLAKMLAEIAEINERTRSICRSRRDMNMICRKRYTGYEER